MNKLFPFKVYLGPEGSLPLEKAGNTEHWKQVVTRNIAYILLFAYTLMLCKPAAPLIIDGMAHTFWESQHLMTVHEEHGKFHVHYETVNSGDKSEKNKPGSSVKANIDDQLYTISTLIYSYPQYPLLLLVHNSYQCSYCTFPISANYPPPKA